MTYDPATDPVRIFCSALPHYARRVFNPNIHTVPAIRLCHSRGVNLTELAQRCAKGLDRRARADVQKLLTYRLLREAGLLTDDQETPA